ncbi:TRAP transporter substrate-binding protein [uncultured Cohaesibacter sp.]|uniref:TRAP transporter substrate-binding protein n=1 Tax=uncultured Cohaesibacter sp. TaxID=1002546 RepID=UPI0029C8C5FC|nr:TRAP transporter substrate-binding protein [uncultured Cohaesibacter sp.]
MFKKSAAVLALAVALAMASASQAKTIIKLGHGTNEQFHMHRAMVKFKELVETGSNGELEVHIFPNSQLGPDREMIESVQSGILEMAVSPSALYSGWDPAFSVIELPYMYPSKAIALKVMHGEAGQKLLDRLENQGLIGLGYLESGQRQITNNVRAINKPEDLEGVKLRTMKVPAHVDTFKALGANPTPMNFGEVYSAMQQGVIDGQENPISIIASQRFYEVQKYLSLTGHVFTVYIPVISQQFFSNLPAEQQELIRKSMDEASEFQQQIISKEETEQLELIAKEGVEISELTSEQRQLFSDATESIRAKFRDSIGADVFDDWVAAVKAASAE